MVDITSSIGVGLSNAWGVIGNIAMWILYIVIFAVLLILFLYLVKFKYPLYLIFESNEGGRRVKKDRGMMNKKTNEFKALKNRDVTFPYPESKHEYIEGRGSAFMALVRNQSASFLTITPNPHFIPANYDMRQKLANDFKNSWSILAPKQSFWDKYGAQVLWIGSMGLFLVVIILILKRMDAIVELGKSVATAQVSANKQVLQATPLLFMLWGVKRK